MVKFVFYAVISFLFVGCGEKAIVEPSFADSVLAVSRPSAATITTEQDLLFWKKRVDSLPELVHLHKYAEALTARFHIYGDIKDLQAAETIYKGLNAFYKGSEPDVLLALAGYHMLQHRFHQAKAYVDSAGLLSPNGFGTKMMLFDVSLELGDYQRASSLIKRNRLPGEYAYNFRLSKWDHYSGSLDSAISHMMHAAELARTASQKQLALSNAADLHIHAGNLDKAYQFYKQCIQVNPSDFHSILGLGWIALVHDKNDSLAKRLFRFVRSKMKSPDPLWRLVQASELNDAASARKYALEFAHIVTDSSYGNMYNKYLIDLYTGILNQPGKAVGVAQKEVANRSTPQTYAWLAHALLVNGQVKEAYDIYQSKVSGRPLEALELFWMGKLMNAVGKGYNAKQFYKAAAENQYDLSPKQQEELAHLL